MAEMNYKILEDPKIAEDALRMIVKTKESLDDFVDTLEMLSDPKFKKNLKKGLSEARRGMTVKVSTKDLRKRHNE